MEFKKGDRVKVINRDSRNYGEKGIVHDLEAHNCGVILKNGNGQVVYFNEMALKLAPKKKKCSCAKNQLLAFGNKMDDMIIKLMAEETKPNPLYGAFVPESRFQQAFQKKEAEIQAEKRLEKGMQEFEQLKIAFKEAIVLLDRYASTGANYEGHENFVNVWNAKAGI